MNPPASPQISTSSDIDKELKAHIWILLQLLMFGVIALLLGPFGELSLTRSSPLWAFLGMAYGTWKVGYFLGLSILCIAWLAALAHRLSLLADCRGRRNARLRVEAERQAREERRRNAKAAREAAAAAEAAAALTSLRAGARSKRFDF